MAASAWLWRAVIFPRVGQPLGRQLAFSRFRLHWSLAYGFIVGLALLVVARVRPDPEVVRMIGLNLLLFFQTLFFLQGLAVAHWFVVTRKIEGGARTLLYLAVVLAQVVAAADELGRPARHLVRLPEAVRSAGPRSPSRRFR